MLPMPSRETKVPRIVITSIFVVLIFNYLAILNSGETNSLETIIKHLEKIRILNIVASVVLLIFVGAFYLTNINEDTRLVTIFIAILLLFTAICTIVESSFAQKALETMTMTTKLLGGL